MHLSEEDLGSFEPMVAGLLTYDAVGELYAQTAPQPPAGRPKEVRRQINAASTITPGSV